MHAHKKVTSPTVLWNILSCITYNTTPRHRVYSYNRSALSWWTCKGPCSHVLGSLTHTKIICEKRDKNNKSLCTVHIISVPPFFRSPLHSASAELSTYQQRSRSSRHDDHEWATKIIASVWTEINFIFAAALFPCTKGTRVILTLAS